MTDRQLHCLSEVRLLRCQMYDVDHLLIYLATLHNGVNVINLTSDSEMI